MLFINIFLVALALSVFGLIGSSMCRKRRRCKELRADAKRRALRSRIGLKV